MKVSRTVVVVSVVAGLAALTALTAFREGDDPSDPREEKSPAPVRPNLYDTICGVTAQCADFDSRWPYHHGETSLGIRGCVARSQADLFGIWSLDEAGSRTFEWRAPVRHGGVFPSLGYANVGLGCWSFAAAARMPFPGAVIGFHYTDYDWAALESDEVFIPLEGEATLDHDFRATATLDARGEVSTPHASVSITGPGSSQAHYGGLGPGDAFPWATLRATVVRVVEPQEGRTGAIGWVAVKLAGGAADPPLRGHWAGHPHEHVAEPYACCDP